MLRRDLEARAIIATHLRSDGESRHFGRRGRGAVAAILLRGVGGWVGSHINPTNKSMPPPSPTQSFTPTRAVSVSPITITCRSRVVSVRRDWRRSLHPGREGGGLRTAAIGGGYSTPWGGFDGI